MNSDETLTITPDTRIGPLLDRFPKLEEPLMKLSPAYAKLRNPLLRKTVAKVATLRQVAQIGDVQIGTLINTLRQALGIEESWQGSEQKASTDSAPQWLKKDRIKLSLDAEPMLAAGEHPLGRVMSDLQAMPAGQIFELITPFVPAPLLDAVTKKGYAIFSSREADGRIHSYFCKLEFEV